MKVLSVKEYANLVNKSDKSIYKLVKNSKIESRLNGKKIEILVDENLYNSLKKMSFSLNALSEKVEFLEKRLTKIEEALKPKIVVKKTRSIKKVPIKKVSTKKSTKRK